jgi:hypothetical protein
MAAAAALKQSLKIMIANSLAILIGIVPMIDVVFPLVTPHCMRRHWLKMYEVCEIPIQVIGLQES